MVFSFRRLLLGAAFRRGERAWLRLLKLDSSSRTADTSSALADPPTRTRRLWSLALEMSVRGAVRSGGVDVRVRLFCAAAVRIAGAESRVAPGLLTPPDPVTSVVLVRQPRGP